MIWYFEICFWDHERRDVCDAWRLSCLRHVLLLCGRFLPFAPVRIFNLEWFGSGVIRNLKVCVVEG